MGISEILEQLAVPPIHAEDLVYRTTAEETTFPADPWCARASWLSSREGALVTGVEKAYGRTRESAMLELRDKLAARLQGHETRARTM